MRGSLPEGTITFLFTDIEGSTRMLQRLGDRYTDVLGTHARLLRDAAARHGGYEVDTYGDSFFITFTDAGEAISAAVDAQRSLLSFPWLHGSPVLVRMGLHTGTAAIVDADYVGFDVHRASRIASAAHGGQIVVSAETHRAVDGTVDGVAFLDLGEHVLKDIDEPEHIHQVLADGLRTEFSPLRSLEPSTNIPRRAGTLVGRRREFAELRRLVGDAATRIVTVKGPGGTGKTRLAGAVALDALVEFSGGAWFVDLTPVSDPHQVSVEIATVIGASLEYGRPPLDLLVDTIGRRRLLLLLDNFEQVISAAHVVARLVERCPRLTVLVTSRVVLSLRDEEVFPVAPLSLPPAATRDAVERSDAGALFVERARTARPDFRLTDANAVAVAEVCELVDGLPLAIELAAARIKLFTAEQLRLRLDRALAGPLRRPRRRARAASDDARHDRVERPAVDAGRSRRSSATLRCSVAGPRWMPSPGSSHLRMKRPRRSPRCSITALYDRSRMNTARCGSTCCTSFASTPATCSTRAPTRRSYASAMPVYYLALAEAASTAGDDDTTGAELDNLRTALDTLLDRAGRGDSEAAELGLRLANTLGQFWYRH